MIASQDDVYKSLSPYFDAFTKCILDGNKEQKKALNSAVRAKARRRTISGLMNDLISHEIRERFVGIPGVEVNERYAQTQLTFSSNYRLKIKQSKNRKLSFISTQLAMEFLNQVGQLQLPNMPSPVTNLILTYEWDNTRTNIVKTSLLCPATASEYHWELPITVTTMAEIITEAEPIVDSTKEIRRVKPKQKNRSMSNEKKRKS